MCYGAPGGRRLRKQRRKPKNSEKLSHIGSVLVASSLCVPPARQRNPARSSQPRMLYVPLGSIFAQPGRFTPESFKAGGRHHDQGPRDRPGLIGVSVRRISRPKYVITGMCKESERYLGS